MTMQYINLTPHKIVLQNSLGERLEIPPSGTVARIDSTPGEWARPTMDTFVPVHEPTTYGEPIGLPEPVGGTLYIVSALFAGRVGNRRDVVYPGTGPKDFPIRNAAGQVEAVTKLILA